MTLCRIVGTGVLATALLGATEQTPTEDSVKRLEGDLAPLIADFNAAKGRPRLVTILSPT